MTIPNRYSPIAGPKHGGFGQVIRCFDNLLNRDVVIKKILHPTELRRIVDEVVALQQAKSKHVVEIFDVIIENNGTNISIVEEYLPGPDLTNIRIEPNDEESFLKIAYQIAKAIEDIHSRNVVHRDIKHNNIMFDASGYIRLFDFGLAKTGPLPGTTASVTGTPGFMAPELYTSPSLVDKPVDIYAFGALMFYFATGGLPKCARPWPSPPTPLNPADSISNLGVTDSRLASIIDQCLDIDPNARPTASELRMAFERRLLFGKHKAIVVSSTGKLSVNTINKPVRATYGSNYVDLNYDGYDFIVTGIQGSVFINNNNAKIGDVLIGSHVITLGARAPRYFVTFDVSHPEVSI